VANLLATRSQFKAIVPSQRSLLYKLIAPSDDAIDAALSYVSGGVANWLHRALVQATYRNWFSLDGYQGNVFLTEWPVQQVLIVGGMITVGTIYYNGTQNYAMMASDLASMTLSNMGSDGLVHSTVIKYSDQPTLGQLFAAVQAVTGWQVYYSSGTWAGNPSRLLKPIGAQMAVQGVIVDSAHWIACKSVLIDEYTLELAGSLGRWVYVEWNAGYVLPVDKTDHSGLDTTIQTTLPPEITLATINAALDYLVREAVNGGLIKSESLGDYSYTAGSDVNDIIERQNPLLFRYKRLGWI